MVWPILISLAVTPRISAAPAASSDAANAMTTIAPNPAAKRISPLPRFYFLNLRRRPRKTAVYRDPLSTKHAMHQCPWPEHAAPAAGARSATPNHSARCVSAPRFRELAARHQRVYAFASSTID